MFRFIWTLSVHTRDYLHRYMPSNRLLAAIRTRRGLKWGLPAMLVALPYFLIAYACSSAVADGGPGWLHLVVLEHTQVHHHGTRERCAARPRTHREAVIRRRLRREASAEADTRVPALHA